MPSLLPTSGRRVSATGISGPFAGPLAVDFARTVARLSLPRPSSPRSPSPFAVGIAVALLLAGPARAQLDQALPLPPESETEKPEKPAPKLTKPPEIRKQVEPVYPPEAFAEGLSGEVALLLTLDAEGHVTAVIVARPAGHGFDEAAVAAAREMEFSPAEIDGKPAPIRIEYVIHFAPKVVPAPPPPPAETRGAKAAPPPQPIAGGAEPSEGSAAETRGAKAAPPPQPIAGGAEPSEGSAVSVGRVVVRGLLRERGTREPIPGGDVAVIRRGAGPDGADLPAEITATTGDDGRFEVRTDAPGPLRSSCRIPFTNPACATSPPPSSPARCPSTGAAW